MRILLLALLATTAVAEPLAVRGDRVYRLHLRLRRDRETAFELRLRELPGDRRHRAQGWPGYRPPPPGDSDLEVWVATGPEARQLAIDTTAEVLRAELTDMGPVHRPGSANYVVNGACDRAGTDGRARDFQVWGSGDVPAVEPAGREGAGLIVEKRTMLAVATVPALTGVRYRCRAWVRGRGRVMIRYRGSTAGSQPCWNTVEPATFTLEGDGWQEIVLDNVALPPADTLGVVIDIMPHKEPIYVDDISVRMGE